VIEFDAEVEEYEKGYTNFRQGIDETTVDYRLCRPSNIQIVSRDGKPDPPPAIG
jgi:hypothetical protein